MQLRSYLDLKQLSLRDFARQIGSQHARTVARYSRGEAIPCRVMMARIAKATDGAVLPNDFYLEASGGINE